MSAELIAILAVGGALGGAMLATMRGLRVEIGDLRSEVRDVRGEVRDVRSEVRDVRSDVQDVRSDVGELRERMARLEGLFEGFTRSGGQEGSA